MANSFKVTSKLEWLDDSVLIYPGRLDTVTIATTSDLVDIGKTQIVGTTHEVLAVGDVTDDAYAEIANPHATAVVQIGYDVAGSFTALIDIPPGYPPARLPRVSTLTATYVKSDTASTPVRVTLIKIAS